MLRKRPAVADLHDLAARATEALKEASKGSWDVRYYDGDLDDEKDHFAKSIELSAAHNPETGTVAWRLQLDADDTDRWLNIAYFGNGPRSRANALLSALAPDLAAALPEALRRADEHKAEAAKWGKQSNEQTHRAMRLKNERDEARAQLAEALRQRDEALAALGAIVEAWDLPDGGQPSGMDLHGNLLYDRDPLLEAVEAGRALSASREQGDAE